MELNDRKAEAAAAPLALLRTYTDYRAYLRDWYESRKSLRPGFSYRRFSALLGLKSPNFMQLVISGQRGISRDVAEKLCRVMQLKGPERTYFLSLVEFDQAENCAEDRERAEKALLVARRKLVTSHVEEVKEIVVSEWYHMLVRELVFLKTFEPTGQFVARALNGLIGEEEAARSLNLLREAGFLVQENGRWVAKDVAVDTGDFVFARALIEKSHRETLKAWAENLARLNPREQELGLLHIPINSAKIPELRERIRKFQDEMIGWLCEETEADRVVQLGTYLIPFDKP